MSKRMYFSLVLLSVILAPSAVFAHEHQAFRIGNKSYEFTVGSLNEPIVVDDKTGVDLRIKEADATGVSDKSSPAAGAVMGLEQTLKVELIAGDKKKVLDLTPAYNDPGAYRANFFPTVETTYSYRLFGKVNDTDVSLLFTCNPAGHPRAEADTKELPISDGVVRIKKEGAFGCPIGKADLGFPEQSRTIVDLASASESSGIYTAIAGGWAAIGIIAGALGMLIALGALARKR
ncbi:MAG: hypothetical protein AAB372_03740 [Patescibacteria group bacterium]